MIGGRTGAVLAVGVLLVAACGGDEGGDGPDTEVAALSVPSAAALWASDDGSLLVGGLTTGRIVRWVPDSSDEPIEVVDLEVADEGQRGLLAVVELDGSVVWSRVRPDGVLVVERLGADGPETVWEGPATEDRANGGRLLVTDNGLVIGIGDLLDPEGRDEPGAINGRLLVLDGAGPADQIPAERSAGWNNPFALATDGSTIWVADNAPGSGDDRPERLWRDDDGVLVELAPTVPQVVPSGLEVLDDGRLLRCEFLTGELNVLSTDGEIEQLLADDCRYAVVALPDGRIAYAADDRIVVLG